MNRLLSPEEILAARGAVQEHYRPGSKVPLDGMLRLPLATVLASAFASKPTPSRAFLDSGSLFPIRNVTMLSGDGGTGKSLLALQLAAAVATGTTWLGMIVDSGPVLYFSAEDDLDEMHVRLKDIAAGEHLDLGQMTALQIAAMAGKDAVLATDTAKGSTIGLTPLFERLKLSLGKLRPRLVVLDNLADTFAGNENVRPLARQFVGALRGLSIEFDCVVLLLAHPSLSGLNSGAGTSGNTAWNNSVRSRLYLVRDKDDKGGEADPDRRILQTMKANYGPTGGHIQLRWEAGRFMRTDQPTGPDSAAISPAMQAERVFLHLLRWHVNKGMNLSPSKGPTYAPAVFARHPQCEGIKSRQFETAMNVLLDNGRIEVLRSGPPSKARQILSMGQGPKGADQ